MGNSRFNRQILVFGSEGQAKIAKMRVGIVGLGGIGSHVLQALAYLGTQNFTLIDDDLVEESNLNRLVGATNDDAVKAVPKVIVSTRVLKSITPEATVLAIQKN